MKQQILTTHRVPKGGMEQQILTTHRVPECAMEQQILTVWNGITHIDNT